MNGFCVCSTKDVEKANVTEPLLLQFGVSISLFTTNINLGTGVDRCQLIKQTRN